jgi:hypothetical protein
MDHKLRNAILPLAQKHNRSCGSSKDEDPEVKESPRPCPEFLVLNDFLVRLPVPWQKIRRLDYLSDLRLRSIVDHVKEALNRIETLSIPYKVTQHIHIVPYITWNV